jgi:hypothetical protein
MDIFNTQFSFSNRVSSTSGKVATFLYVGFFMYLSIVALMSVFSRTYKNVFTQQTYNLKFTTDAEYYKKLHLILSIAVYRTDNVLVENPEIILKEFFNFQMSYISSNCFDYRTLNFYDKKISQNNNMVTYFTTYDINTLNDFLKISMDKTVLKSDEDIANFFKKYILKFHVDYYFLKDREALILKSKELFSSLSSQNPVFFDNNIIDYIYRTKNQDYLVINSKNYLSNSNNIQYYFNPYILILDPEIILSTQYKFKSFNLENRVKDEFASSLSSFQFKLSARTETFNFSFKKISSSFAEIAGIMSVIKFVMFLLVIIMTFIKRNQYFMHELYHDEIIIKKFRTRREHRSNDMFSQQSVSSPKGKDIRNNRVKEITHRVKDSEDQYLNKPSSYLSPGHFPPLKLSRNSIYFKSNYTPVSVSSSIKDEDTNKFCSEAKHYFSHNNVPRSPSKKSALKPDKNKTRIFKINENMDLDEITPYRIPKKLLREQNGIKKEEINLTLLSKFNIGRRKANYSCLRLFLTTFVCSCGDKIGKLKRQIFHKVYQKNMEKLDIIWVQKKLNQVDILSYVLLEPRQRVLMEYVKKEQMTLDFESGESKFSNEYALTKSMSEHVKILQNISNEKLDERDKKIIQILDPRLSNHLINLRKKI